MINAMNLRNQFATEAQTLDRDYPRASSNSASLAASVDAFNEFVQGNGPSGSPKIVVPETPPGYTGPDRTGYNTVGGNGTSEEQCNRTKQAQDKLNATKKGCHCKGIANALQTHEDYHYEQCVAAGGANKYWRHNGCQRAVEEANAYQRQIDKLQEAIDAARQTCKSGWGHDSGGGHGAGKSPCPPFFISPAPALTPLPIPTCS